MPNLQERPNYEKYLRNSALHVYKVSPNSTTHKSQQFHKGVWWIISILSSPCCCWLYLMWPVTLVLNFAILQKTWMSATFWHHYQRTNRAVSAPQLPTVYTDSITQTDRWIPWYGFEWRVQAGQVKSSRTAVTTDQLASVLTHRTLIIIIMNLNM